MTRLRLFNYCDHHRPPVVVLSEAFDGGAMTPLPWKVVKRLPHWGYHPFEFSAKPRLCLSDDDGNFNPGRDLGLGEKLTLSGRRQWQKAPANRGEIAVHNSSDTGFGAWLYRASQASGYRALGPHQQLLLRPQSRLCLTTALSWRPWDFPDPGAQPTYFSLIGIASADILLVGGGAGRDSGPFRFHLENIIRC